MLNSRQAPTRSGSVQRPHHRSHAAPVSPAPQRTPAEMQSEALRSGAALLAAVGVVLSSSACGTGSAWAAMPAAGVAPVSMSPYEEAKKLVFGPTDDGYIRACQGNLNPNCVSTASTNELYAPAWRASDASAAAAAEVLELAVQEAVEDARFEKSASLAGGAEYRAWSTQGLYGRDVLEFLLKPEGVTNRGWEGDSPGVLVTYRTSATQAKYIWPIQQPLSDFGAQRKRLQALRERLGWQVVGCELIECYQ